ncbi:MAG: dephospho-CoA kinase [Alphaproteobacteria bacterium]|nr:dephospho-CoA kinase [Alphaproteobacteria bacterium]MDA8006174.1 dephospho-CoA kinase [Alphaproteobacteria bacterium]
MKSGSVLSLEIPRLRFAEARSSSPGEFFGGAGGESLGETRATRRPRRLSREPRGATRLQKPRGLFVLGLTGPMASGKSALSRHFRARGLRVFDADAEVADLRRDSAALIKALSDAGVALAERDRREIAESEASVRREALRRAALLPGGLAALEGYFHPRVRRRAQEFLWRARREGCRAVVLEIPLLFESGYAGAADYVMSTEVSAGIRLARLAKRRLPTRAPSAALQMRLLSLQWDLSRRRRALAHSRGAIIWTGLTRGETRRRAVSRAPRGLRRVLRGL